jgi:four helix bundle protein
MMDQKEKGRHRRARFHSAFPHSSFDISSAFRFTEFINMTNELTRLPWEEEDSAMVHEEAATPVGAYDLEERTAKFGESVIVFLKQAPLGPRTNRLVDQLTGCGTSIGANYVEADDAVSKKEFIKIIGTCRKEARECKFFIRMLVKACPELRDMAIHLWREANELHLIFSRIRRTAQANLKASEK